MHAKNTTLQAGRLPPQPLSQLIATTCRPPPPSQADIAWDASARGGPEAGPRPTLEAAIYDYFLSRWGQRPCGVQGRPAPVFGIHHAPVQNVGPGEQARRPCVVTRSAFSAQGVAPAAHQPPLQVASELAELGISLAGIVDAGADMIHQGPSLHCHAAAAGRMHPLGRGCAAHLPCQPNARTSSTPADRGVPLPSCACRPAGVGIGGGISPCGDLPARMPQQAAAWSWRGIYTTYSPQIDPWAEPSMAGFRRVL